jgi:[acyl-carrier-protein] S-malonyltransferase
MKTGIMFSGQGAQVVGMGKSFYEASATARSIFDLSSAIVGWDLKKACFEGPADFLTQTRICQPALFVHGFTAFTLLKEANPGMEVTALGGLSLGELTALAAAGVFDFATGLKIVAQRGRLMQEACETTAGGMASIIGADKAKVAQLCAQCDVDMSNLNCPGQIVISGSKEKIVAAVAAAAGMGFKRVIPLNVAGAYHSRLMKPAAEAFEKFLAPIKFSAPRYPVFTNTTGQRVEDVEAIKAALVKQVYSPVLWEDCFRGMVVLGVEQFYECGVGGVLTGLARRIDDKVTAASLAEMKDIAALSKVTA